jgi:hypothetical protein
VRSLAIARAGLRYGERLCLPRARLPNARRPARRFFDPLVPLVPGGLPGVGRAQLLSRFVADVDRLQDLYLRGASAPWRWRSSRGRERAHRLAHGAGAGAVLAAGLLIGGVRGPGLTARRGARRGAPPGRAIAPSSPRPIVEAAGGAAEIAMAGRERDWIERADRQGARLARHPAPRRAGRRDSPGGLMTAVTGPHGRRASRSSRYPPSATTSWRGSCWPAVILLAMAAVRSGTPAGRGGGEPRRLRPRRGSDRGRSRAPAAVADPARRSSRPRTAALELRDVRFRYRDRRPVGCSTGRTCGSRPAVRGAPGPSGCGKTTLRRAAVRFRDPVIAASSRSAGPRRA